MEHLTASLIIGVSGAIGANARYFLGLAIQRWSGDNYPWGTFFINVSGSLLMGLFTAWLAQAALSPNYRLFLLTGLLGGYTTFSSYSMEAVRLWERREFAKSWLYLGSSVVFGFMACAAGVWLARRLIGGWGGP